MHVLPDGAYEQRSFGIALPGIMAIGVTEFLRLRFAQGDGLPLGENILVRQFRQ
ncbi:MAG: hypothetical protein WBA10_04840 [Elainellaceae cyanobacterium]